MSKVIITTSSFNLESKEIKDIQSAGYEVVLSPYGRRLTEDEVKGMLAPDVVGMIAGVEPLTRDVIEGAQGLKVISRCGIGMDSVDTDAANDRAITVINTPDAPTKAVAELTIGLMLDCLRGVPRQDHSIRKGEWVRPMGGLLSARTIGMVGYGRIGKTTAKYAAGIGAKIIAYDSYVKEDPNGIATFVSMDELYAQADIVSLHIPYSDDFHHLIDEVAIAKMKDGAIVINTSRGGLVDEDALAAALKSGKLSCAALDVYEQEPYKGSLVNVENAVLSAHTGSYAKESRIEQEVLSAINLLEGLKAKD